MGESVPVLVVFSGEALDMILTCCDRALFRALVLVGQHVSLQVLEYTTALGQWAEAFLPGVIINTKAASALAAGAGVL